jgi:lipoprotein-anchoring transpeptidase ErfK/SrfK
MARLERGMGGAYIQIRRGDAMTKARTMKRWVPVAAGVAILLAFAFALAPRAGAGAMHASSVDVVGSGTINSKKLVVRARPSDRARRVAVLDQFRSDFRPQFVLALSKLENKRTGTPTWYRISVPGRPNGRTGWVRAGALELRPVHKRLIIYRGERRFEFWDGSKLVRAGKVAVGARGAETPLGLFYVTWKFDPSIDPDWAILGAYAFETSAYSKLTDWPGGGIVGVHGTPWPELLGQAVSHGCVRVANGNIEFLRTRVPVGTPVKIVR